jgi:hypothetical protein
MPTFKNINYPYQLIDTLRSYFAINSEGNLSILYKICLCVIYPFQGAFDGYDLFRRNMLLIANCKWQIGQVENLLNYLFDPVFGRIKILQNTGVTQLFVRNFDLSPGISPVYARSSYNNVAGTGTISITIGTTSGTNSSVSSITVGDILFDGGNGYIGVVATTPTTGTFTLVDNASRGIASGVFIKNYCIPAITPQYMPNFDSIFINTAQLQISVPFYSTDAILSEINAVINMIRLKGTTYKLITL